MENKMNQNSRECVSIAICGKGGVGKSAFTALLVRACMANPKWGDILAVDADPASGLGFALGVRSQNSIGAVREKILDAAKNGDAQSKLEISSGLEYMIESVLVDLDGYSFMAMGRTDTLGCFCSVNELLREAIQAVADEYDTVIIDGEAGIEQLNRQVFESVDALILLTDGSRRGMHSVRLLAELASREKIVEKESIFVVISRPLANEWRAEANQLEGITGGIIGVVPLDSQVASYDSADTPLTCLPEESPAVEAVSDIAEKLLQKLKR